MPDVEALKRHASITAQTISSFNSTKVCNRQFSQIEKDERTLLNIYKMLDNTYKITGFIEPSAEWLLDNFYVIFEEIRIIRQICNQKYIRNLPARGVSQKDAVPAVYSLAYNLVEASDAYINEHIVCVYVNEYQNIHALTCREIWAIPVMIKIALIKKIKTIAERLADLQTRNNNVYKTHPSDKQSRISCKALISNAIASLKFLSGVKWEEIFEEISVVDKILSEDPAVIYSDMDFETRNYYRIQIEQLSRITSVDEPSIARETVNCAFDAAMSKDKSMRETHVGFYLIKQGQNILKKKLGLKCKGLNMIKNWINNNTFFCFLSCLFIILAVQFLGFIMYLEYNDVIWYGRIAILSFTSVFIPIISIAVSLTTWFVTRMISPSIIPKIEIKGDIPQKFRTMVIIPALLPDSKRTVELINQLEVYYLANNHKNLHFALVGDFKDSATEDSPKDQDIIMSASIALDNLNMRYCPGNNDIFFFFIRRRKWNPTESIWMSWERKRGAIVEFNRLLKGHSDTGYYVKKGDLSVLNQIKYVITLDCDTKLPGGAAKRLIGAMAHPLNHADLSKNGNRVIQGYGLLQPRIGISIESANHSHFSSIFSGQTGIDPYTSAVSDIYQDMFGEGIYVGKGIYDVDAFYKLLDDMLPENSILSHDLLEGCIVRAGLITDVEFIDSYPSGYMAYALRLHRWTRGDWQLLPWLGCSIHKSDGKFTENPLSYISKWKITDNMRRSLLNPSLLLILLLGFTVFASTPFPWLILFLVTLFSSFIIHIIDALFNVFAGKSIKNTISNAVSSSKKSIFQSLLNFVFLPYQSWLMIDAISRVIVRIFFTRKGLLEWITAEDTEKAFKGTLMDYHRKMWSSMLIGVIFLLWMLLLDTYLFFYTIPIALIWILAPTIAYYISKAKIDNVHPFSEDQLVKLRQLARNTWGYFDDLVDHDVHWLPPDNFQIDPPKGAAYRTSPTNIGLWLMSVISARDLGFIGTVDAIVRLENTISTMEKLERWNGHFYNWYSLTTLKPIEPMFISSVDSGNLAVYLLTLTESLKDIIKMPLNDKEISQSKYFAEEFAIRCERLIEKIDDIFKHMDFKPLYDKRVELFSVGFDTSKKQLVESSYDLLASEARQTSFIAIAKGDVPIKHWFKLGRRLTIIGNTKTLLSWSGTMFEYLMPNLVMKSYNDTLLSKTCIAAVKAQIEHCRRLRVPWGISESAFYAFNSQSLYQYKAFGIPELGYKRGLNDDTVITPYASVLALQIEPIESFNNIEALRVEGLIGKYGLYEAIDYTLQRVDCEKEGKIVKTYMAHHQGMIVVALNNCLNRNIMQKRFHSHPMVRASELLLQERIPKTEVSKTIHNEYISDTSVEKKGYKNNR